MRLVVLLALLGLSGALYWRLRIADRPCWIEPERAACAGPHDKGRLYEVNGYPVLELSGTPEEMGEAHGRLLRSTIRGVIADVLRPREEPGRYERIMRGARVMERYQPDVYRREMKALAQAAGVGYMDVVALQLFGDAERGELPWEEPAAPAYQCANYAVFGPATRTGECIVGRNFDYWYADVARYASVIIHYRPAKGRRFVTVSWAGVINGWSLMNDARLVAANNNAFSANESLEGISTCFLQRLIMENAATVQEGIAIAQRGPRAVGTIMLLAGGDPPDAVEMEFDHKALVVRRAERGYVLAANSFRALGYEKPLASDRETWGRYGTLLDLIEAHHGKIDRSMNFAATPGVPLGYINLHCALFFPSDLRFSLSMGKVPAADGPFRTFGMSAHGIVAADSRTER